MYKRFLEEFFLRTPQPEAAPPAPSDGGGMEEPMITPYLHATETKLLLQVKKDLERHEGFREYAYPDPLSSLYKSYPTQPWGFKPAREILDTINVSAEDAAKTGRPWTVGFGFTEGTTLDSRINKTTAERKLETKILEENAKIESLLSWYKYEASFVTKTVLINMSFQMGLVGLLGFKNTLQYIKEKKYYNAANNMRKSLWYKQTPSRASELARRMETQEIPSQYKAPEKL